MTFSSSAFQKHDKQKVIKRTEEMTWTAFSSAFQQHDKQKKIKEQKK